MRAVRRETDPLGFTHEKYQQYYKGLKVEHATYTLHARQGKVESMSGKVARIQQLNVTPSAGTWSVKVYDLRGYEMKQAHYDGQGRVTVASLPQGLYQVVISDGQQFLPIL